MTDTVAAPVARDPFDLPDVSALVIGVLGGTGDQGRGLARRLAMAGQQVVLGSRDAGRARDAAEALGYGIRGEDNLQAALAADVVIAAVPYDGHRELLADLVDALAGKIVIDCVNRLGFDKQGAFPIPVEEGSAAQQAAAVLPESTVVGAFHNVSAVVLLDESIDEVDTDVWVLGDVRAATDTVQALVNRMAGMRGIFGGRLRTCAQVEGLTANLIAANRRYKAHTGLRVTDV